MTNEEIKTLKSADDYLCSSLENLDNYFDREMQSSLIECSVNIKYALQLIKKAINKEIDIGEPMGREFDWRR